MAFEPMHGVHTHMRSAVDFYLARKYFFLNLYCLYTNMRYPHALTYGLPMVYILYLFILC